MIKQLVLDMDGTMYDLYAVENWLPRLRAEDPTPYLEAPPMWDMYELSLVLDRLRRECGWMLAINSWLSLNASLEYKRQIRAAKREALARDGLTRALFDEYHFVAYGTPKMNPMRFKGGILIDDNAEIRAHWEKHGGLTIDPTTCDLVDVLSMLIQDEKEVIRWIGGESYLLH